VKTGLVPSYKRVKLFVLYLARGGYYHQLGRAEGLSLIATAVYLHQVAAFFADTASQYITNASQNPNHHTSNLAPEIVSGTVFANYVV